MKTPRETGDAVRDGSRLARFAAVAAVALALLAASPAWGATPAQRAAGTQAATSVRFDPGLKALRGSQPVALLVRLAYAPTGAARSGPRVARARLVEARFLSRLSRSVPSAVVGQRLRAVFGGVSLRAPGGQVRRLATLPGVVAVRRDVAHGRKQAASEVVPQAAPASDAIAAAPEEASSPAPDPAASEAEPLEGPGWWLPWRGLGRGAVVGVLDGGVWPEHPAFAPHDSLPAPAPRADGSQRTCEFGSPAAGQPPFACNTKVIAGEAFLATYIANHGLPAGAGARDVGGRGTAMASASVGRSVALANLGNGIFAGATGVAPEAHLAAYRVCGPQGCYASDVIAGVAEAVADGVDVIVYGGPGGTDPGDAVEQAFLDAYAAGVLVVTPAGDGGPAAGSVQHRAPWTLTAGASSAMTELRSNLSLASGSRRLVLEGFSVTGPIGYGRIVDGGNCTAPPAGLLRGRVALCATTPQNAARTAGNAAAFGATGVVLRSTEEGPVTPVHTQVPSLLLEAGPGAAAAAFVAAHAGAGASSTRVHVTHGRSTRIAPFSGRGPGGSYVKPDLVAEGVGVIAATPPTAGGTIWAPATGTAIAAARAAGAAAAVIASRVAATPSDVRSALTLSAKPVTNWNGSPAITDAAGAGRVSAYAAILTPLSLEAPASTMRAATTAASAAAVNLPTILAAIPGRVTVYRTVVNRSAEAVRYSVSSTGPVRVTPAALALAPGSAAELAITLDAPPAGRVDGQVVLTAAGGSERRLHLPVIVERTAHPVRLEQSCLPVQIAIGGELACLVRVVNDGATPLSVVLTSHADGLEITSASGAELRPDGSVALGRTLQPALPPRPAIAPATATPSGFLPLASLGASPIAIGDEQAITVQVPSFAYGGRTFTSLSVVSNGYLVPGGVTGPQDITPVPALGQPTRPNGVLAPYWADLTGVGAEGLRLQLVAVADVSWIVVEWSVLVRATGEHRAFQVWLRTGGTEDVLFTYPGGSQPGTGGALEVGAESLSGTHAALAPAPPSSDQRVSTLPATPGEEALYTFIARGTRAGSASIETLLDVSGWFGSSVARTAITVTP